MRPSKFSNIFMCLGLVCFISGGIVAIINGRELTMELALLLAISSGVFAIWIKDEDTWKTGN